VYGAALTRYGVVLLGWWPVIAAGVALAVAWPLAPARIPRPRTISRIVLLALVAFALVYAWRLRWFADDAFISLHYARNWIEGNGLVYNPGERVEGYTNFLWLALVAALGRLGLDMPLATIALNLLAYAATIVLVDRVVRRLVPEAVIVPFAAVMTALSYPMVSFATGGLETVFCALLVLAAALAAHEGRTLAAGACGIAATMAHPDHALFYVAIGAVLLGNGLASRELLARERPWWRRPAVRALARYAAPFFLVYLPYFALRWSYYGDPLPNTFYAKSGGGAYYAQGLRYLFVSALVAGVIGLLPAFVVGASRLRRTVFGQIAVVAIPLYLFYVARIGGDFMTGRLLVAVLPLVFVLVEVGLRAARRRPRVAALLAAPMILACLPLTVHRPERTRWHLTDERTFWQIDALHPMTLHGGTAQRAEVLRTYFPDAGPRLAYAAYEIGYLAWRTRFRIIDMHGLVDRELARAPLTDRGRPGHEREASAAHVLRKGAVLAGKPLYDEPYAPLAALVLDGVYYHLAQHREELLAGLRGRAGVSVNYRAQ
jgi:hypothetical protein